MSVQILCPNPDCGASYNVVETQLGKVGRCKKCGTKFPLVPPTKDGGPSSPDTDLDSAPKTPGPALPESFGRYKILKLLGRGGMGSVYLTLDTGLKRQVAVKVPHIVAFGDRPEIRTRFFREAEAAARFQHPNFCPIFDIGEADGVPFLTMAFIEGKTLAASITRSQGWPSRRAAEVARQLAVALAELHREGIVHRDLKPANIMVDARGSLIVMDFGLARWYDDLDSTFTPTGAILGTPAYMPPEQAAADLKAIGPRSDLYSLGVILYELLTGRRAFEGPIMAVLGMIAIVEPAPPSSHRLDLDPALESICLKAMAKKPEDRYASMEEFAAALQAWLAGDHVRPLSNTEARSLIPARRKAGASHRKLSPRKSPPPPTAKSKKAGSPPVSISKSRETSKPPIGMDPPAPLKPDEMLITNSIGMKLRLISDGTFFMGSSKDRDPEAYPNEMPRHEVRITRAFYLGVTEVTQGQYRAVTGESPSYFQGSDDLPVERVSWLDAVKFCNAVSLKEGLTPFYRIYKKLYLIGEKDVSVPDWKGSGYRLPTEAEWEYACRAGPGGSGPYNFGDDAGQLGRHAWYGANSGNRTHPVGEKLPNAFGLFDMHGNLMEWCWDWYAPYDAKAAVDPVGPPRASVRVMRGCSWGSDDLYFARSAYRGWETPGYRNDFIGFRVARVPSES